MMMIFDRGHASSYWSSIVKTSITCIDSLVHMNACDFQQFVSSVTIIKL